MCCSKYHGAQPGFFFEQQQTFLLCLTEATSWMLVTPWMFSPMPYKVSSHAMYINHSDGLAGKLELFHSALSANIWWCCRTWVVSCNKWDISCVHQCMCSSALHCVPCNSTDVEDMRASVHAAVLCSHRHYQPAWQSQPKLCHWLNALSQFGTCLIPSNNHCCVWYLLHTFCTTTLQTVVVPMLEYKGYSAT